MARGERMRPSANSLDLRPGTRQRPSGATIVSGWFSGIRVPRRVIIITGIIAGTVILLGLGAYLIKGHKAKPLTGEAELKSVQAKISRHYLLPTDEEPALATVTDTSKLKTPIFKNSQAGDRILIYQVNQIAIIYRPSTDRIIAVGPVSIDTPKGGTAPSVR